MPINNTIVSKMSYFGLCLLLTFFSCEGYSNPLAKKEKSNYFENLKDKLEVYGPTSEDLDFMEIKGEKFIPLSSIPNLSRQGTYWGKFDIASDIDQTVILDFKRIDFVDVYYEKEGKEVHFKTGYMVPASQKQLGKWNAISIDLESNYKYVIYLKLQNTAHLTEFNIAIQDQFSWFKSNSNKLIQDVGFLGIIAILTIYNLIVFLFGRERGYLFLGIYLLSVFSFFIFASGIMRDFVVPEYPQHTLIMITSILLAPVFYYGFLVEFLDTNKLIPKWDKVLRTTVKVDIWIFIIAIFIFMVSNNYQAISKLIQFTLLINIALTFAAIYLLFKKRHPLVLYFIFGTLAMTIGSTVDVILWDSRARWGDVSRIGFVIEIIFFSVGLGKKIQQVQKDKHEAQRSYIEQLEINEKLISKQKYELEHQVQVRTKELEEAKNKAEEAAKVKSDFLSVMSHEIRTPMNAVIGMIHLLVDENPKPEQQDNLKTLKFSAENLMVLMNDILDFSKIESGNLSLESVSFNLRNMVDGIHEIYHHKAESKDIQFKISVDKEIPEYFIGDPGRLTQVLTNLVSNAIKFTHHGKVNLEVNLVKSNGPSVKLRFTVQDTGIGISNEKQHLIFESFTQAQTDTTRRFGGTGLGLAITKKLLKLFDSQIYLHSVEGIGSRFYFEINLPVDHSSPKIVQWDKTKKLGALKDKRVLVVDDNSVNLLMVESFFRKWDVQCTLAKSGQEALDTLANQTYDIILLDLRMPEMDGYEVARRIRTHENSVVSKTPIIALSANTLSKAIEGVESTGMNGFIAKPFKPDDLINTVYQYTNENSKVN